MEVVAGMGRLIDLTGKRFGQLTVLKRAENNILPSGLKEPMWLCQCDCGETSVVRGAFLRTGHTKSCGCGQTGHNLKDLSDLRFGRILVLEQVDNEVQPSGQIMTRWRCLCDCGKTFITRGSSIQNGHTKSCGCRRKQLRLRDMVGRQFGRLTVVSQADDFINKDGSRYVMWNCTCECGSNTVTRGTSLRSGHTVSCGCHRLERLADKVPSKSEIWVNNYLEKLGLDFNQQQTYPGLVGLGGNLLSYDFVVRKNGVDICLIECQGIQHYQPIDYFGGQLSFEKQQEHDRRKRKFAKDKGILLIEIPCHGLKESDLVELLENIDLKTVSIRVSR